MSLFINLCFTLHFMIQTTKVEMQITVNTNEVTITVNEILKLLEVPAAKTAVVTMECCLLPAIEKNVIKYGRVNTLSIV